MSASLVGSEMCIRDRLPSEIRTCRPRRSGSRSVVAAVRGCSRRRPSSCLAPPRSAPAVTATLPPSCS
eukprot:6379770-Alexandrium_andersonii.AAC.1